MRRSAWRHHGLEAHVRWLQRALSVALGAAAVPGCLDRLPDDDAGAEGMETSGTESGTGTTSATAETSTGTTTGAPDPDPDPDTSTTGGDPGPDPDTSTTGADPDTTTGGPIDDCTGYDLEVVRPPNEWGGCAACDWECDEEAWAAVEGQWCDCDCDVQRLCSPAEPAGDGMCHYGYQYVNYGCSEEAEGRPFLVEGAARTAGTRSREDWCAVLEELPMPDDLEARRRIGEVWLARAAMEHASVAAFNRFALQLLSLGAPPDLIRDAQDAALDELRHAELAYAVASQALGRPLGPQGLPMDDVRLDLDLPTVIRDTIVEGCIGESIAAMRMRHLATRVHRSLRGHLHRVAADEARHAALAWRFLDWARHELPQAAAAIDGAWRDLRNGGRVRSVAAESYVDEGLEAYGVCQERTGRRIHAACWDAIIAPLSAAA